MVDYAPLAAAKPKRLRFGEAGSALTHPTSYELSQTMITQTQLFALELTYASIPYGDVTQADKTTLFA